MLGLINKKKVIRLFAKELAEEQRKADYYFYVKKDRGMSSFILNRVDGIKELIIKSGMNKQIYCEAYKIYDFRNSGKEDFVPDLDKLKWNQIQ